MTVADLNAMDRDQFVEAIGWIFEHSPWVAERAYAAKPFESIDALLAAMTGEIRRATIDEQLTLLRAHPDLGARARMSGSSTAEQAGAGLDRLSPVQFETLQRMNREYRDSFGFPFLYAVKGATVAGKSMPCARPHAVLAVRDTSHTGFRYPRAKRKRLGYLTGRAIRSARSSGCRMRAGNRVQRTGVLTEALGLERSLMARCR